MVVTYVDPTLSFLSLVPKTIRSHADTLDWTMVVPCSVLNGPQRYCVGIDANALVWIYRHKHTVHWDTYVPSRPRMVSKFLSPLLLTQSHTHYCINWQLSPTHTPSCGQSMNILQQTVKALLVAATFRSFLVTICLWRYIRLNYTVVYIYIVY